MIKKCNLYTSDKCKSWPIYLKLEGVSTPDIISVDFRQVI